MTRLTPYQYAIAQAKIVQTITEVEFGPTGPPQCSNLRSSSQTEPNLSHVPQQTHQSQFASHATHQPGAQTQPQPPQTPGDNYGSYGYQNTYMNL